MHINIGQSRQGIPENQGAKKEEHRRPEYGNRAGGNHVLLVFFGIIKAEKSSFHSVGQNHVEKNHPRKQDGNFPIFSRWQNAGIDSYEKETQHSRQNRRESVYGCLFEKVFI